MTLKRNGKPNSTVAGRVGDIYVDLDTGNRYKCTFAYKDSMLSETYTWALIDGKEDVKAVDVKPVEEATVEETPKVDDVPVDIPNEPKVESVPEKQEVVVEPEQKQRTNYHKQFKQK